MKNPVSKNKATRRIRDLSMISRIHMVEKTGNNACELTSDLRMCMNLSVQTHTQCTYMKNICVCVKKNKVERNINPFPVLSKASKRFSPDSNDV